MSEQVQASSGAIIDLTRDINNGIKEINNLGNDLGSHLKRLGTTFQDQGYLTIQSYISKTQKTVQDAIPDLKIILSKLAEYADLLIKSESSL